MTQENALDYSEEIEKIEKRFSDFEATKQQKEEKLEEQEEDAQEEEQEGEAQEEQEGEAQEEQETEQKKEKKNYRQIKRTNYRLYDEVRDLDNQVKELELRNRELTQRLEDSTFLGTEHYAESAQLKLKATKEKMREAMYSGNADEYIELQEELYKCAHEINQAKSLREQNERYRHQEAALEANPAPNKREIYKEQIINDWIANHPEINPDSSNYNKKLSAQLYDYVIDLDEELRLAGRNDLYLSSDYFKNIDNKLEKLKRNTFGSYRNNVGAVRNSFSGENKSSPNKRVVLSAAELDLIKSSGGVLSEQGYIKQKLLELNNKENR